MSETPPSDEDTTSSDETPRTFPCESCGADLEFSIGVQRLKCPFCGFEKELSIDDEAEVREQDLNAILESLATRKQTDAPKVSSKELHCGACGGIVLFSSSLISTSCPYCDCPIQSEDAVNSSDRLPPDAVLPFAVDKAAANKNLGAWVSSRWFAPSEFKSRGVNGKFNGLYLPHWTFDSMTFSRYTGERGTYYYTQDSAGNRTRQTRWTPVTGSFQRFFDDLLVCAAKDTKRTLMEALEPWPLEKLTPFNPECLAGYVAMTYETDLREGFSVGKSRMHDLLSAQARRRIGGDTQRLHHLETRYDALTFKHVLLPVWMLAYRYNNKSYQVVVNACSGEVQGERPYSWVKIAFAGLVSLFGLATLAYLSQ